MSDPYPTKTRLQLLRDIADGYVHHVWQRTSQYARNEASGRKVTVQTSELIVAGWVELTPAGRGLGQRNYQLTDAGRAVLDGAS